MPKVYFEMLDEEVCANSKKPVPSISAKPDWWDKSVMYRPELGDPNIDGGKPHRTNALIKSCPAVADVLSFGYTLFVPIDIDIDARDEDHLKWRNAYHTKSSIFGYSNPKQDYTGFHYPEQLDKYNVPEGYHKIPFKINTYYGIKTDPGYSTLVTHPMHDWDLPYFVQSGIIDTDKIASRFPYPLFIKQGFVGTIKAGMPLLQVIPFKREDYEAEIVSLDKDDLADVSKKLMSYPTSPYRKLYWQRKKFE